MALGVIVVLASSSQAVTLTDRMHGTISKGNRHYDDGEHQQALDRYLAAERLDSLQSVPHFNAGDALYRLGKFPEGAREFLNSSASPADSIAAMSYYNLGNSMFKSGDLKGAAEAYKRSLLIDPDDEDAKYNLEYAIRMMEQQEQDSEQQQDKKEQPEDKQDDELAKEKEQQEQQDQGEDEQDQDKSRQGEDEQAENREQPGESQPQPDPGEISPEDLERILAAIEASDKDTQEEMLKKAAKRKRITGKDW
ncbi:MAG: tetratricopeptide repeat protein [Candidatus Eisenbacteria bacterium]